MHSYSQIEEMLLEPETTPDLELEQEILLTHELKDIATASLLGFTVASKPDYEVNWHHEILCQHLDMVLDKKIKRLMVFMPPRHGKSELVSRRFPAYAFGKNPNLNIICGTYSADLASMLNRDVQRIMETPSYQYFFPETKLSSQFVTSKSEGSWIRNAQMFEIVDHQGIYRSTGVGGGITGMGADIFIIDDPYKNRQEANSAAERKNILDWYRSTASTRLSKDGAIILNMTRWHEMDIAGFLEQLEKADPEADKWTVLRFPAIAEPHIMSHLDPREVGEALWPDRYSVPRLKSVKANLGTREFSSLYQQTPTAQEGTILKREWFTKFYKELPSAARDFMQVWDLSFDDKEHNSFTVGWILCKHGADIYLVDEFRAHLNFPGQKQAVRTFSAKHPKAHLKIIEKKANATALLAELQHDIPGMVPFEPKGSKEDRASAASPVLEAGNFYLPDPSIAPWVHDVIEELVGFPGSTYNDRVDTFSMGIIRYRSGSAGAFTEEHIPKVNSFVHRQRARSEW